MAFPAKVGLKSNIDTLLNKRLEPHRIDRIYAAYIQAILAAPEPTSESTGVVESFRGDLAELEAKFQ